METPVFLSPAMPSELLTYILKSHMYPTTLMICYSRADFLASLTDDVSTPGQREPVTHAESAEEPPTPGHEPANALASPAVVATEAAAAPNSLLRSPLYQVAISRHIRTLYFPTVTHLRAYLTVFKPNNSRVAVPPASYAPVAGKPPCLVVYGMLDIHRQTSEWSAQGLGATAAALVEVGHRLDWQVLLVEPRRGDGLERELEVMVKETLPILSGSARRAGLETEGSGWSGRTVEIGRVLGRWFRFQRADWDQGQHAGR